MDKGMKTRSATFLIMLGLAGCAGQGALPLATPTQLIVDDNDNPQTGLQNQLSGLKVRGLTSGAAAPSGLKILDQALVSWPSLASFLPAGPSITLEKYAPSSVAPVQVVSLDATATSYKDMAIAAAVGLQYAYKLRMAVDGESFESQKVVFTTTVLQKPKDPDFFFNGNDIDMLSLAGSAARVRWVDRSDDEAAFELEPRIECWLGVGGNPMLIDVDLSTVTSDGSRYVTVASVDSAEMGERLHEEGLGWSLLQPSSASLNQLCNEKKIHYRIRALNASGTSAWIQTNAVAF